MENKMKVNSPYLPFTQNIPSNEVYTEFLLDILDRLSEGERVWLNKEEREKLTEILDSSFNQVEILDKAQENTPYYAIDPVF